MVQHDKKEGFMRLKKVIISILISLFCNGIIFAEDEPLKIITGPYLQNLSMDKITIMWQTNIPSTSKIEYDEKQKYSQKITETAENKLHEITISKLKPNTKYYYKITNNDVSASGSFTTAPKDYISFQFIAYGDNRTRINEHKVVINAILSE